MKKIKTVKISEQLHSTLTKLGQKKETYEDIIWKLINIANNKLSELSIEEFTILQSSIAAATKQLET